MKFFIKAGIKPQYLTLNLIIYILANFIQDIYNINR